MNRFVSVILPCRNEEKTIGDCIARIKDVFSSEGINGEIIVSDSSTDNSAAIARELGAKVISHGREGYGYAYQAAFKEAAGDILIIGDSDGTYDFAELPKLLAMSGYDMVIGSRMLGKIRKGAMPWHHRYIGNPVLSFLLRMLFNSKVKDTQSGFRLIKRSAWERLNLHTTGMEFASEMIIRATLMKMRIAEVPITYYPRKKESRSKLKCFRDGWKHLRFMLLYSPSVVFLIPGLLLLGAGILLIFSDSSPLLKTLFIIAGYQIIILGIFAKTYAAVHLKQRSSIVDWMNNYIGLDKGIFLGAGMIILGLVLLYILQSSSAALALFIIGIQTFFSAFFMSIIGIEEG
jgi:glycosyltransferase involved in cell wall biosynthesis